MSPQSPRRTGALRWPSILFASSLIASSAWAVPTNQALDRFTSASTTYPGPAGCPDCYAGKNAVDSKAEPWSRWTANAVASSAAPQWLEVDLGRVYRLSSVLIQSGKENGFGRLVDFNLQMKNSAGEAYRNISGGNVSGNSSVNRTVAFAPVDARFVRLQCLRVSDDGLCRIYDLKVFGEISTTPAPSPSPTPTVTSIPNQPPVAKAGSDQTIQLPVSSVTLNSTGSSDPEGKALTFAWSKISGGSATIASPSGASTAVTGLVAGSYVFRLTVRDAAGAQATDDIAVIVNPEPTAGSDPRAGKIHVWKRATNVWPHMYDYDVAVYLPKDYGSVAGKKYPMVLSLHGRGGTTLTSDHNAVSSNPEGFIRQVTPSKALAGTYPGIVIAPNGPCVGCAVDTWWDYNRVRDVVVEALSRYAVDPDRVVATGLSSGSSGVSDQIVQFKDLYAGYMPLAYFPPRLPDPCVLEDFPIWAGGNIGDGAFGAWNWTNQWDGLQPMVSKCAGYTGEFKVTVRDAAGHAGWDEIWSMPEVQQWLVNQRRK